MSDDKRAPCYEILITFYFIIFIIEIGPREKKILNNNNNINALILIYFMHEYTQIIFSFPERKSKINELRVMKF